MGVAVGYTGGSVPIFFPMTSLLLSSEFVRVTVKETDNRKQQA